MVSVGSGAPFLNLQASANAYVAAAMAGDEGSGPDYFALIAAARATGALDIPALVAARQWRAWLHPRGKDGRFIETFSKVNIFADARDAVSDRRAPKRRAKITRLTESGAHVTYYGKNGKEVPADPENGYPAEIPAKDIHDKIVLAPREIARLDTDSTLDIQNGNDTITDVDQDTPKVVVSGHDRKAWESVMEKFNEDIRKNPPPGKPHNTEGAPLQEGSPEWEEHQQYVLGVMERLTASGLTSGEYLRDSRGQWSQDARDYFEEVVTEAVDEFAAKMNVPKEHKAVVLGGLPGAGKSTTVQRRDGLFADAGMGDRSRWVTVNSDDFKERIIARGEAPQIEGLSPMETAFLIHELSSEMCHMFGRALMAEGYNVILDTTIGGSDNPVATEVSALLESDYTVDAIFVDTPVNVAVRRQSTRWLAGLNELRSGTNRVGGRVVPAAVNRLAQTQGGKSQNLANFEYMVESGSFKRWAVIDNSQNTDRVLRSGTNTGPHSDAATAFDTPGNIPGVY